LFLWIKSCFHIRRGRHLSTKKNFLVQQNIIGYAGVFAPGGAEADVLTVGVIPTHRGKGIARQLMAMITDWAKQQGSIAMMLEVKVDNSDAIGLYESLGYSKLNVRKDYFGAGLDALVMRLDLP
jgi:ribosomal-protein-alanine N-acetyltransferase